MGIGCTVYSLRVGYERRREISAESEERRAGRLHHGLLVDIFVEGVELHVEFGGFDLGCVKDESDVEIRCQYM